MQGDEMSIRRRGGVVAIAAMAACTVVSSIVAAEGQLIVWPSQSIKWMDISGTTTKQAVLWGDPARGAYGALKRVPGGTVLPLHTHKHESRLLIVKGTVEFEVEGKRTSLPPGSFAMVPAGLPHAAVCQGSVACEYFEQMSGAFDSRPVKK
jgi:mannose-6-phosphate isomerase-like protein (cupin superfamily)